MRPITEVLKDGDWKGRPAFCVGSGGSTRGLSFGDLLKGELTLGTNEEFRWNPTITLAHDVRWIKERKDQLDYRDCKSIKVYFKGHPHRAEPFDIPDWVHLLTTTRDRKGSEWGTSLYTGAASRSNCGIPALNLADMLGADPIFLIGFDCKTDDQGRTHGHDRYPAHWGTNPRRFKVWLDEFYWASTQVKAKVYNLSPRSAIECFEKRKWAPLDGGKKALCLFERETEIRLEPHK